MSVKYNINEKVLSVIKDMIINTDNKMVKMAGIHVSDISERHVRLELPLRDIHVNHVGTAYAISIAMLMEVAGASLLRATYGLDKYVPIIKRMDVLYVKPARTKLVCDISISEKDAMELILPVEERGRGNFTLPVVVFDIDGNEIAQADFTFYLIPHDYKI